MGALQEFDQLKAQVKLIQGTIEKLDQYVSYIASTMPDMYQKMAAVEQSVISMGTIVSAVSSVLGAKQLITDAEVFDKIMNINDSKDKEKVKGLLDRGGIEIASSVEDSSLVVVKQKIVQEDKEKLLSNYRVIDLMDIKETDKTFVEMIQGKVVGDELELPTDKENVKNTVTILEIYTVKQPQAE